MAELSEDTKFNVSVKTLAGIAVGIFTLVGMWFALQADIQEAKELNENGSKLDKIEERLYEINTNTKSKRE